MRTLITILIAIVSVSSIYAQETRIQNQEVAPRQGVAKLALDYYGIEFSAEQRKILAEKPIELIYTVDEQGGVTLGKVKGIQDAGIIDSFERVSAQLAPFKPMIRNGKAEQSIYFMQLEFPEFKKKASKHIYRSIYQDMVRFRGSSIDDFEYIDRSGGRSDIAFGGLVNGFLGNAGEHLGLGGGMYMDFAYKLKSDYSIGFNMNVYGNKLKKPYPVRTVRPLFKYPPSLLMGVTAGKWVQPDLNIRGEVSYILHNISKKLDKNDPYGVQLHGFSIGAAAIYKVGIGKEKTGLYYGAPVINAHNLDCRLGIRYVKHKLSSASGIMVELGIGYLLSMQEVYNFEFKE